MLGAIIGDVLGSTFEFYPMKTKQFELLDNNSHFTDDTVMTVAVADSIMNEVPSQNHSSSGGENIQGQVMEAGLRNGYIKTILNHITVLETALQ